MRMRDMKDMNIYREGADIHWNLMIQNLVREAECSDLD